jgi:hypothetical protein
MTALRYPIAGPASDADLFFIAVACIPSYQAELLSGDEKI